MRFKFWLRAGSALGATLLSTTAFAGTIIGSNSGKCLDVGSGSITTGVQVIQRTCSWSNAAQQFAVTRQADGTHVIKSRVGDGCLDVQWDSRADSAPITTYACNGSGAQRYRIADLASAPAPAPTPQATPQPTPQPTPTSTIPKNAFRGRYHNSLDFTNLVVTRNDAAINFTWAGSSPANGVGSDNFSVRWEGDFDFAAGTQRFTATADDGVRLYVDGNLVIDRWVDQAATDHTADVVLTAGTHRIRMDYYERSGNASARLTWAAAPASTPTTGAPVGGGPGSVFEGFDNGFGILNHSWTAGSANAYIQNGIARIDGTREGAGVMQRGGSKTNGFGNGLFEIRAKLNGATVGDNSGPALVLWPADDHWTAVSVANVGAGSFPYNLSREVDIGEIDGNGRTYMASHFTDCSWGRSDCDAYNSFYVPAPHDQWQWHTYAAYLQNDKITYMVNGVVIGVDTKNPSPDTANGGINHLIGIMNRSSNTSIEVDWVRWTPEASVR